MAPLSVYFSPKNLRQQYFPFPKTILSYFFENAKTESFKKLNQTCKTIFVKYQIIPINWLILSPLLRKGFKINGFSANDEKDFDIFPKKLCLINCFKLENASASLLKSFLPKIFRCDVKSLVFHKCADIKFDDFKLLTKSGTVEFLHFVDTKMFYKNSEAVPLEDIFALTLKANCIFVFSLEPCHVTSETMKIICAQKRQNKINDLSLESIDGLLDPKMFMDFITKNGDEKIVKDRIALKVWFTNDQDTNAFYNVFNDFYQQ